LPEQQGEYQARSDMLSTGVRFRWDPGTITTCHFSAGEGGVLRQKLPTVP